VDVASAAAVVVAAEAIADLKAVEDPATKWREKISSRRTGWFQKPCLPVNLP
jgi:hypothetical protein